MLPSGPMVAPRKEGGGASREGETMTISIKLALYDEDANGNSIELSREELEDIRSYIERKQDVYGFAIASVDIIEE